MATNSNDDIICASLFVSGRQTNMLKYYTANVKMYVSLSSSGVIFIETYFVQRLRRGSCSPSAGCPPARPRPPTTSVTSSIYQTSIINSTSAITISSTTTTATTATTTTTTATTTTTTTATTTATTTTTTNTITIITISTSVRHGGVAKLELRVAVDPLLR